MQKVVDFTLRTFFRHFSLYEFSFKPRRELVLKCEPFLNNKFNVHQVELGEMTAVEPEEAEKLKAYLSIFQQQNNQSQVPEVEIDNVS